MCNLGIFAKGINSNFCPSSPFIISSISQLPKTKNTFLTLAGREIVINGVNSWGLTIRPVSSLISLQAAALYVSPFSNRPLINPHMPGSAIPGLSSLSINNTDELFFTNKLETNFTAILVDLIKHIYITPYLTFQSTQKPPILSGFWLFQPFLRWATAYFPNRISGSIIGADVFHGLVRNGAGWYNVANVTLKKG